MVGRTLTPLVVCARRPCHQCQRGPCSLQCAPARKFPTIAETGPEIARWLAWFLLALLSWTALAYGIHRLAHHPAPWNRLARLHRAHHAPRYLSEPRPLRWHHLLFWFDTREETMDVWITLTLPALLIAALLPAQAPALLGFHYLYEVLLSDGRFDHNPAIDGPITRVLACGTFHLEHHRNPGRHFGLILTLWDHIFGSTVPSSRRSARMAAQQSAPKDAIPGSGRN